MSDLISRKDAIEAVDDIDWYHQNKNGEMVSGANPSDHQAWYKAEDIYSVLESLPSAEPKTPSNGSITCVKSEKMHDRTMDGLISRQDACEAVKNEMESWLEGDRCDYRNVVDAIMDLPSAEKTQLSGEDATSVCKCPCEYREPCDYCHYDAYRGHGCPAEEGLRDE